MPVDKPKWGGRRIGPDGKPLGGRPRKPVPTSSAPAEPKAEAPKNLDLTRLATMLPEILAASQQHAQTFRRTAERNPFQIPWFPKAAIPPRQFRMAMDSMPVFNDASISWLAGGILNNAASEALIFPGYTYLSQLAQQADFRNMAETIADDATRKWIKFEITGTEEEKDERQAQDLLDPDGAEPRREQRLKEKGKTDKVKALTDFMVQLGLQKVFYDLCRDDGFFGRTHLYLNFGDDISVGGQELKTPIGDGRDAISKGKVGKDRPLRSVKTIEPLWAYPTTYNAQNPLAPDWYDPTVWYVMGTQIHASRLLRFIGRPVPDILKPAYAFGGISLSQLIQPSVDIWIRTRNSVSELVHSFSVMVLSTDLSTLLQPGSATNLLARATLFNALRDNQNLMVINKTSEDFNNVSASIAGLDDLQAQAQEHVASTGRIPLVKYTGLQPKGLNASAEGEIAVYDDTIMAYQNRFIRPNLTVVFNFAQLSLWGEIDEEITFEFEALRVMTEKEKSEKQKSDAERDGMRLDQGAISAEEIRKIIINDPELPYTDLNPDEMPEPPDDGMGGEGDDPEGAIGKGPKPAAQGGGSSGEEPGGEDHAVVPFFAGATDEWSEGDHPRGQPGNAGQFGPGGGGSSSKQKIQAPQFGMAHGVFTAKGASSLSGFSKPANRNGNIGEELDPSTLTKVGAQKGSNPGGVYKDADGKEFYVKQGKSKDHVRNEMIAAALYDLAGTPTLNYRPTKGGTHIATEIEKLSKDNASKLSKAEKSEAARDFAVHAWLANWDAVGLGGDNLGTIKGVPTALDLGGALKYRAQGSPKGKAFGKDVGELDTLRDASMNKDAAGIFGDMTPSEMRESARYVTRIPDAKIKAAVEKLDGSEALANKLIARKNDIAERARFFGQEGDPSSKDGTIVVPIGEKLPIKELNGVKFGTWRPPADWAAVDGQDLYDEPEYDPGKKKPSSGCIIREPDGRVWLIQPRGGYGGYEASFPKGGLEEGLSLQANAIKEVYEESGLKVRIVGFAGDHEGDMTKTRYYHAVREGGDPSQHDDESEGVVLAPAKKAEQFLNRKRDREVLAHDALFSDPDADTDYWLRSIAEERRERALQEREARIGPKPVDLPAEGGEEEGEGAEDEFKESDHPRDAGGKWTEGSGGGSSTPKHGYETIKSPHITYGETPEKTHKLTVAKVLVSTVPAGSNYRRLLMKLIKEASQFGNEAELPKLKHRLITSLAKSAENSIAAGKAADAKKIIAKMKELGAPAEQIADLTGGVSEATKPKATEPIPEMKKAEAAPAPKFEPPSESDLAKAKKTVPLQLQYVPTSNQLQTATGQAEANKLVGAFNAKYANKEMASQPALIQKVNDFKTLNVKVGAIAAVEQQNMASIVAKEKAAAKEKGAAIAAQAKKEAEENAKKNATVMQDLGITEQEAEGFNALVGMLGGNTKDVVAAFKGYEKKAQALGYPVTGFQAALISNYSDGGYGEINSKLRSGSWTIAQHVYVKLVNKALAAMPTYAGDVTRNTSLTTEQQGLYKVGHVVEERAFTSTSTGSVFSGNTRFKVTAIGKRGASIKKLSNHQSEDEVLFQARTFFKVTKVEGAKGGKMVVHMTEMEE